MSERERECVCVIECVCESERERGRTHPASTLENFRHFFTPNIFPFLYLDIVVVVDVVVVDPAIYL